MQLHLDLGTRSILQRPSASTPAPQAFYIKGVSWLAQRGCMASCTLKEHMVASRKEGQGYLQLVH